MFCVYFLNSKIYDCQRWLCQSKENNAINSAFLHTVCAKEVRPDIGT